jgi:hypothetical protein
MQLADHIRKARQIQNKFSHPSCAAVIVAAGSSAWAERTKYWRSSAGFRY